MTLVAELGEADDTGLESDAVNSLARRCSI
jgi:hypothetical protein